MKKINQSLLFLFFIIQADSCLQASMTQMQARAAAAVFPENFPTASINEKAIDQIYGTSGLNIAIKDLNNMKKTYCYLEFLVKIEKIKENMNLAKNLVVFKKFLEPTVDNSPLMPTQELVDSKEWQTVLVTPQDIINSPAWQIFIKSIICESIDNNVLFIIDATRINNQISSYIPNIETAYPSNDFTQLRLYEESIQLQALIQAEQRKRYLLQCTDWKNIGQNKIFDAVSQFKKEDFYNFTHSPQTPTTSKKGASQQIIIPSPIREQILCYFMLINNQMIVYEKITQANAQSVLAQTSSSLLSPNFFMYNVSDFIYLNDLLTLQTLADNNKAKPIQSSMPMIQTPDGGTPLPTPKALPSSSNVGNQTNTPTKISQPAKAEDVQAQAAEIIFQQLPTNSINESILDKIYGSSGLNIPTDQLENLKKTYCYLEFLVKIEKVKNNNQFAQYKNAFNDFLQPRPDKKALMPTQELVDSNAWKQIKITQQDIQSCVAWQNFIKSMICDLIDNEDNFIINSTDANNQIFPDLPNIENAYSTKDFTQVRLYLESIQIQALIEADQKNRYLEQCLDWKTLNQSKIAEAVAAFKKTDFYNYTHNEKSPELQSKNNQMSPYLTEQIISYFILTTMQKNISDMMNLLNLAPFINQASSSLLSPNLYTYIPSDFVYISDFLSLKNLIDQNKDSLNNAAQDTSNNTDNVVIQKKKDPFKKFGKDLNKGFKKEFSEPLKKGFKKEFSDPAMKGLNKINKDINKGFRAAGSGLMVFSNGMTTAFIEATSGFLWAGASFGKLFNPKINPDSQRRKMKKVMEKDRALMNTIFFAAASWALICATGFNPVIIAAVVGTFVGAMVSSKEFQKNIASGTSAIFMPILMPIMEGMAVMTNAFTTGLIEQMVLLTYAGAWIGKACGANINPQQEANKMRKNMEKHRSTINIVMSVVLTIVITVVIMVITAGIGAAYTSAALAGWFGPEVAVSTAASISANATTAVVTTTTAEQAAIVTSQQAARESAMLGTKAAAHAAAQAAARQAAATASREAAQLAAQQASEQLAAVTARVAAQQAIATTGQESTVLVGGQAVANTGGQAAVNTGGQAVANTGGQSIVKSGGQAALQTGTKTTAQQTALQNAEKAAADFAAKRAAQQTTADLAERTAADFAAKKATQQSANLALREAQIAADRAAILAIDGDAGGVAFAEEAAANLATKQATANAADQVLAEASVNLATKQAAADAADQVLAKSAQTITKQAADKLAARTIFQVVQEEGIYNTLFNSQASLVFWIGQVLNAGFGVFTAMAAATQDKAAIERSEDERKSIQTLWKFIEDNKVNMTQQQNLYLDELHKKHQVAVKNQSIGLQYYSNFLNGSINNVQDQIAQALAQQYIQMLSPDNNGLRTSDIGSTWGLQTQFDYLYPSQGFISTTLGRPDFPYAQEVAQAPLASEVHGEKNKTDLTDKQPQATKLWFNQRAVSVINQPVNAPLNVEIKFRVIYNLNTPFHVGLYLGGNYHDYKSAAYLQSLKEQGSIDLNEEHLAKMFILKRDDKDSKPSLGLYEHQGKGWITQESMDANIFNNASIYHMSAKLHKDQLTIAFWPENNAAAKWSKTTTVTPCDQRTFGVIFSGIAIEWGVVQPSLSIIQNKQARLASNGQSEIDRERTSKKQWKQLLNPKFGSMRIISPGRNAILQGNFLYTTQSTDLIDEQGNSMTDYIVFALTKTSTDTLSPGDTITNIGCSPTPSNSALTPNAIISLITGNVYNVSGKIITNKQNALQAYMQVNNSFPQGLADVITKATQIYLEQLTSFSFGDYQLSALSKQALDERIFIYTCATTITTLDITGKPIIDYLIMADIVGNSLGSTIGMPPSKSTQGIVSLITGNVYGKTSTVPIDSGYSVMQQYIKQYGQLSKTILDAITLSQQAYNAINNTSAQIIKPTTVNVMASQTLSLSDIIDAAPPITGGLQIGLSDIAPSKMITTKKTISQLQTTAAGSATVQLSNMNQSSTTSTQKSAEPDQTEIEDGNDDVFIGSPGFSF